MACFQPNDQWHDGTEVIAQYNFQGRSAEDLPFQKGDLLIIRRATSVSYTCLIALRFGTLKSFTVTMSCTCHAGNSCEISLTAGHNLLNKCGVLVKKYQGRDTTTKGIMLEVMKQGHTFNSVFWEDFSNALRLNVNLVCRCD